MAEKKLRKIASWRIKYILMYVALVLFFIALLVATIISLDNGIVKVFAIIYEAFVILIAVGLPIAIEVYIKKESKKELQYGISKEEQEEYLRQTKNCDIYAK